MLVFRSLRRYPLRHSATSVARMHIGVPRETKDGELRVGLYPDAVRQLVKDGQTVWVEASAGEGSGYHDDEYRRAGGTVAGTDEVWSKDLIVKVKELQPWEYERPCRGQIYQMFQLMSNSPERLEVAQRSGAFFIANEQIEMADGRRPILEPMSRISGRMAAIIGCTLLQKCNGGSGVFLSSVGGCPPGRGLVVGGGSAGQEAVLGLLEMGAIVTLRSRSQLGLDRAREFVPERLRGGLTIRRMEEDGFEDDVISSDLLIGSVSNPGKPSPKLISKALMARRRPGSAYVDVGVDQGGISETCHMRYFSNPTYIEEGNVHYCVGNMPAAYPRASTFLLASAALPYVRMIAKVGLPEACRLAPELNKGLVVGSSQL